MDEVLSSYQKKIGSYDKQKWEKTIDDRIVNGLNGLESAMPRKVAKVKTELIDLDLIRGTAFTKAKPQQGWLSATYNGIHRVLLMPFYIKWWSQQTNGLICFILLSLYVLQVISLRIYFEDMFSGSDINADATTTTTTTTSTTTTPTTESDDQFSEIPASEVLMPIVMMVILGAIHTQIVGTKVVNKTSSGGGGCGGGVGQPSSCSQSSYHTLSSSKSSSNSYKQTTTKKRKRKSKSSQSSQSFTERKSSETTTSQQTTNRQPTVVVSDEESGLGSLDIKSDICLNKKPLIERRGFVVGSMDKLNIVEVIDDHRRSVGDCIPSIKISEKLSVDNSEISSDDFDVEDNDTKQQHFVWRRLSESRHDRSSCRRRGGVGGVGLGGNSKCQQNRRLDADDDDDDDDELDIDSITRRYSEGSKDFKQKNGKLRDRLRFKKQQQLQQQQHKRRRVKSLHLSPPQPAFAGSRHHKKQQQDLLYSSCDSEGTLSPTTPNTPTPGIAMGSDMDWPLINSDASSDGDDDDDDSHQDTGGSTAAKYFIYPEFGDEVASPLYSIFNELCHDDTTNETKVSCAIWQQHECQKVDLSVMDISSSIIRKVDSAKHSAEYIYLGFVFSIILAILPGLFRIQQNGNTAAQSAAANSSEIIDLLNFPTVDLDLIGECIFGSNWRVRCVVLIAMIERLVLSLLYFFLLCVAERTFKQRFLYAKYFSQLTRRDRAKRSEVPHFRLHKVRNLKIWLSVRSYLRRHGPIRSVDAICSSSFVIAVSILTFICLQLLKESEVCAAKLYCWEMVFWNLALGLFIMRLMILGSRINRKYRENLSILITEQINLYLQMEQKPHKKDELTLANHVLKLAADLLKELESPYKISGFCANPYLYNITKVVVLSAFSAVLTELLGFKLKLYKIKLR